MEQKRYKRGTTFRLRVTVRDPEDALTDPTSINITLTEVISGTARVTTQAMSKSSVGKYFYDCQSASSWAVDWYTALFTAVSGGYTVKMEVEKAVYLT